MNRTVFAGLTRAALLGATIIAGMAPAMATNTVVDGNNGTVPTPPGLYVTPVAPLKNATQQLLNPGLPAYPNFVAGEALKAVLSPDGHTLAILTGGHNQLFTAAGAVDTANSTQYLFIYDVSGANKTTPLLTQVIKQFNAHAGLVWSPDSTKIYAAGGADDAVYT